MQDLHEGGRFYWLDTLWQDIRYGARLIKRSPLLSFATVVTLTLGIGINTGVFTLLNGMLLRARVDKDPDSFAHLSPQYAGEIGQSTNSGAVSVTDYRAYQSGMRSMSDLAAWGIARTTIGRDDPTQWLGMLVTCNFFHVYGLEHPKLGRLFRPEECVSAAPVVVIGEDLWRRKFDADPQVLGATLSLNRQLFTVIGVVPSQFSGQIKGPGIWMPYTMQAPFYSGRDFFRLADVQWLTVEGRLAAGQTRATAQAELTVIARQQDRLQPGRKTTVVVTNGSFIAEPSQRAQLIWLAPLIMGALTLILLLACTNVTMLLLSRAAARQREIAIRLSLGAGRSRLLRMLLVESLMLAGVAGAISAYVASRVPVIMTKAIVGMPHYPLQPNFLVFGYLAGVTLLAGIMAGMAPAAESLKVDLTASLKGHEGLFGSGRKRTRGFLVGAQVAMSMVLLVGAGLFVRAEYTMFQADPGFDARRILMVPLRMPMPPYTADSASAFYRSLAQRVQALPGVQSVGFASVPPYSADEGAPTEQIRLPGQAKGSGQTASVNVVSPAFFDVLRIPMVRGRAFREGEVPVDGAPSPVVVSEAFARGMWPGKDPLGQTLEGSGGDLLEVIGVARDVRSDRFGAIDGPHLYRLRKPRAYGDTLMARFVGDAVPLELSLRGVIREMDREMMPAPQTLQSFIDSTASLFWRIAEMVLFMGVVAIVLAIVGIYGVVAFAVSRRTHEMGIRMALGATKADIVRSVLASGMRPIGIGLGVGLVLSLAGASVLAQALRQTPFALDVRDPVAYVVVSLLLAATAMAAMFGPARRAAKSDPALALRQE